MKTESLMWLLPVVFMLHDFEEIIMGRPWVQRNASVLKERFPAPVGRALSHVERLSTGGFALAVAEEFVLLSGLTLLAVERDWYALWAGVLLGFFLHLLVHIGQFLALRRYVPVILTSIPAGVYCVWALLELDQRGLLNWGEVGVWAGLSLVALAANLGLALRLAGRFDRWLANHYSGV